MKYREYVPMELAPSHRLWQRLNGEKPSRLCTLGNTEVLSRAKVAFFSSTRCPGHVILAAHDQAARWRDEGRCVVGGFHSPIEKDCLRILLRGHQPMIVCPARGLDGMRLPQELKRPLADGRLLLVSPFSGSSRRATRSLSQFRNRFAAALADEVVFAYIAPGGHLEELSRVVAGWGVPQRRLVESKA